MLLKTTYTSLILLISTVFVFAQTHNLTVQVKDVDLNPVHEASIFIDGHEEVVTDSNGTANFSLNQGQYTIYSYLSDYTDEVKYLELVGDTVIELIHKEAIFWSTTPTNPPLGVGGNNGVRLTSYDGRVYFNVAYGGLDGTTQIGGKDEFFEYDPVLDVWTELPSLPFSGGYGISTAVGVDSLGNAYIYAIKGYWVGQKTWFARYDIENSLWHEDLNFQIPWNYDLGNQYNGTGFQGYPRNGSVLIWDTEDFIYFFPGSGYGYENYDWYRYSISLDIWEDMGELPYKQGAGNAGVFVEGDSIDSDNDYLFIQFGTTPSGDYTDAEFWKYNITTNEWQKLADHGYGADDGSMMAWDGSNYIYHAPGAYEENSWDKGINQKRKMMRYSISEDYWSYMESSPYYRWGGWDDGGGIVIVDSVIYALKGGSDIAWAENFEQSGGGSVASSQFWSFSLKNTVDFEIMPNQGSGSIYPNPGRYSFAENDEISFLAMPDENWKLLEWMIKDVSYSSDLTITVLADEEKTVQAIFVPFDDDTGIENEFTPLVIIRDDYIQIISENMGQECRIYDMSGRLVYQDIIGIGAKKIPLPKKYGIYILILNGENTTYTQKFVVK